MSPKAATSSVKKCSTVNLTLGHGECLYFYSRKGADRRVRIQSGDERERKKREGRRQTSST